MISKIVLTLLVIAGAIVVVRQRKLDAQQGKPAARKDRRKAVDDSLRSDLRIGAYLFLILMVGVGAALYYYRWQDDHTVLTVNLLRENQAEPISFRVYKYQLNDRSFVTVDGRSITVASTERMEVIGLE